MSGFAPFLLARHARELAVAHCLRSAGVSCAWYHGLWPFLSALGLVTVPAHHSDFYRRAIRRLPRLRPAYRVLVCGTADHALPELISDAFAASGQAAHLAVLDRCETPLRLSREWAARRGETIDTIRCDILDFRTAGRFDLICAHSFLGYFDAEQRARLVERWRELLRPGGRALVIHRIRPRAGEWIRFTSEQALAFRESVAAAAETRDDAPLTPQEIAESVREYTARFQIRSVTSKSELGRLFRGGGFSLRLSELGAVKSEVSLRPSGPTAIGDGFYVSIEARAAAAGAPATSD